MATACGLIAICSPSMPADVTDIMRGLRSIQHRGPHTWGVSCLDSGIIVGQTNTGLVPTNTKISKPYSISTGIAHVGYSANPLQQDFSSDQNPKIKKLAQPSLCSSHRGDFAVAFNGKLGPIRFLEPTNINNTDQKQPKSDIERLISAIKKHKSKNWIEVVHAISASCLAAYTFVVLTTEGIYYARDVNGYRPLFMTQCFKNSNRVGVVVTSEQIAGTESLSFLSSSNGEEQDVKFQHRSIAPGTLGYLRLDSSWKEWCINSANCNHKISDASDPKREQPIQSLKKRCALEAIHFMRGGGQFDELVIDYFREECGRRLAQEDADAASHKCRHTSHTVVVGCPRSGISAGRGYAAASGIPYVQALRVASKVQRTASAKNSKNPNKNNVIRRRKSVPHLLISQSLSGLRVILVDDLIIKPEGIKRAIELLREAGAVCVDVRIASPRIVTNCNWGTYLPDIEDLTSAQTKSQSHTLYTTNATPPGNPLANAGAHSVKYLSQTGFRELIGSGFCNHCFLQP